MRRLVRVIVAGFAVFSLSLLPLAAQNDVGNIKCTLKGVVIDRPQSSELRLLKQGEDLFSSEGVSIPIRNGVFEYTFHCDHEELYQLIFYDEWMQSPKQWWAVSFISEQGVINFTLHTLDERKKNFVEGGSLNKMYYDFQIECFNKQFDDAQEFFLWMLQYAKERPTIAGYSILAFYAQEYIRNMNDILPLIDVYQTIFAPKYPNHPYTASMTVLFTGSSLKAGMPFVDFTAIGLDREPVKLSERIAGKSAILHLWTSWCSPCLKTGVELIPIYEEFRDKGFTVIGIAREKNIFTAETVVKRLKYPWENLVEINNSEQIWEKYGIGNFGGSHFLIDEKGAIIAVSPSIEEIRNFLEKKQINK